MKTYLLSPQALKAFTRRIIWTAVGIILFMFAFLIGTQLYTRGSFDFFIVIPMLAIVLGVFIVTFFFSIRSQTAILKSIRIRMDEEGISREQARIPPVRVNRTEINEILTYPQGLTLMTNDKFRNLLIPYQLEDENGIPADAEIREILAGWAPIRPLPTQSKVKSTLLFIGILVGMGIVFMAPSFWIVLPVWALLIGYYIYVYNMMRKSQGIDPRFRRNMLLVTVFLFLGSTLRLISLGLALK